MNEDMKIGAKIALEGVKEELIKVRAELKERGMTIEEDLRQSKHI